MVLSLQANFTRTLNFNQVRLLLYRYRVPKKEVIINKIICLDLEATCDSPSQIHPQEIIEIACCKIDFENASKQSYFHSFVKPSINPTLTPFCKQFTGITQTDVDEADTFDKVYHVLLNWMREQELLKDSDEVSNVQTIEARDKFAFATCGNYDIDYLVENSKLYNIELPIYFKQWINVRKSFFNHKNIWPSSLYNMLENLDLRPEGRLHSAKDDCYNLAQIVRKLHASGYQYHFTNSVICNKL